MYIIIILSGASSCLYLSVNKCTLSEWVSVRMKVSFASGDCKANEHYSCFHFVACEAFSSWIVLSLSVPLCGDSLIVILHKGSNWTSVTAFLSLSKSSRVSGGVIEMCCMKRKTLYHYNIAVQLSLLIWMEKCMVSGVNHDLISLYWTATFKSVEKKPKQHLSNQK